MTYDNTITAIDIWSSKIKTVIWKFSYEDNTKFHVLGVWNASSNAMRKWNILDMDEFKKNLDASIEEAERMAWEQVDGAFISFNSPYIDIESSNWVVTVASEEIRKEDVDRVIDMAKNGIDLRNKELLKVIPNNFKVDLESGIKSVVGMTATRLEAEVTVFSISQNILSNIKKAVADVWIDIIDVFPNIISAPEWVLSKRQKELWVVCVDIWSSTTWITVYEEGSLKFSSIIPIGSDSVTNDVALWARTSIDVAEALKLEHWELSLEKQEKYNDIEIDLSGLIEWSSEEGSVSKLYLSQIMTARYEEILFFIRDELKKVWKDGMLPEWAVIVWWWSKIKWIVELSKDILRLPVIIWVPVEKDNVSDSSISDPSYVSVIWTMILANKYSDYDSSIWFNFSGIFKSIMKVLKKLIPGN